MGLFSFLRLPRLASLASILQARRTRVLCAEDCAQVNEVLTKVLVQAGCDVVSVADGHAAWEILCKEPNAFDVIVTDYQMPGVDGLELVRRLRASPFSGRIIVHTATLDAHIERAFTSHRVDRVVRKSTNPEVVAALIEEFLSATA